MTSIRHFTASAIVFDDDQRVLLVHHNKVGLWLYPGGHIDPNEDPAQAAQREVLEETGIHTQVIGNQLFTHSAVTTHAPPYTIIEMDVADTKVGPHRHIDLVYVLRAASGELAAQLDEVGGVQWVPLAELPGLDTPPELPDLVTEAANWAKTHWPVDAP
ncbi:NUDIX domain-containing protein [Actinomycetes bacterium KLBMP 9797]